MQLREYGYVSTACRTGDHEGCQRDRIVPNCPCDCHLRLKTEVAPNTADFTFAPAAGRKMGQQLFQAIRTRLDELAVGPLTRAHKQAPEAA
jgi:hypothetical protein